MLVLYIQLLYKTSENRNSDAQKRNATILDVFEDVSECCLMPQKLLLVYQRDEPLDVFIRNVGNFAFVVNRQQRNLNSIVFKLSDIKGDDTSTTALALALRCDGHAHFADSVSHVVALKWILTQLFFEDVIIIEQTVE